MHGSGWGDETGQPLSLGDLLDFGEVPPPGPENSGENEGLDYAGLLKNPTGPPAGDGSPGENGDLAQESYHSGVSLDSLLPINPADGSNIVDT